MKTFKISDVFYPHIEQTAMNETTISGSDQMDVSDGYHTMSELYEHRMALNAFLFKMMYKLDLQVREDEANEAPYIMKSKLHNDGTMFEGYFIVFVNTNVGQISYHYDLKYWDSFKIPAVERIPYEYDGHGSKEVIERLLKL